MPSLRLVTEFDASSSCAPDESGPSRGSWPRGRSGSRRRCASGTPPRGTASTAPTAAAAAADDEAAASSSATLHATKSLSAGWAPGASAAAQEDRRRVARRSRRVRSRASRSMAPTSVFAASADSGPSGGARRRRRRRRRWARRRRRAASAAAVRLVDDGEIEGHHHDHRQPHHRRVRDLPRRVVGGAHGGEERDERLEVGDLVRHELDDRLVAARSTARARRADGRSTARSAVPRVAARHLEHRRHHGAGHGSSTPGCSWCLSSMSAISGRGRCRHPGGTGSLMSLSTSGASTKKVARAGLGLVRRRRAGGVGRLFGRASRGEEGGAPSGPSWDRRG